MKTGFMDDIKKSLRQRKRQESLKKLIKTRFSESSFIEYVKRGQTRAVAGDIANRLLSSVQSLVDSRYEDAGITVHKIPEVGVDDDLSFELVGNHNYQQRRADRYLESGKVYSSQQVSIIPYPEEEAKGQSLLFRTSRGRVIQADPFIDTHVQEFMEINKQMISAAFERDLYNYIKFKTR